ncbi:MAG: hypothetical protein OEY01_11425 [Desulfobulbaceae bacterium]|nr:hypothetical protein [Desulfobulbaceae bacterium]HIJ79461.1 hypothetical protein [Deltaproteobacteria bacterium]
MPNQTKRIVLTIIAALLLLPSSVLAHKVKLFAAVKGEKIEGFGYYPGGGKYMSSPITVFAPTDQQATTIHSKEDGSFSYTPSKRCDHLFVIATQDGHRAEFRVAAASLPATLPAAEAAQIASPPPQAPQLNSPPPAAPAELQQMIDQAVARHIVPLQEDIARYEQRVRLHDIIGGIGYIVGLFGLGAFVLGRKKQG